MGNRYCEITVYSGVIHRLKATLLISKKILTSEKKALKEILEMLELASRGFEYMKGKLNPSNVQMFSSITNPLLVMQGHIDIARMSVSIIEHEMQLMDYLAKSSFRNLIRMLPNSVDLMLNAFRELRFRKKQCDDILIGITNAILNI